ncbi:hypothetical protein [Changchengzhania lutea]|uniref:hypothetical protein n=1 Tax=Changchengzhania lutea TaxID=2049305 RepID=UPI00115C8C9D|nr:hypothetical protein [Changchengzhania lutea]
MKFIFISLLLVVTQIIKAQNTIGVVGSAVTKAKLVLTDSVSKSSVAIKSEKRLFFSVDFTNRYIWRGQAYGGDFFAIQPYLEYSISDKFTIGAWATTNFRKNVFLHNQYGLRGYNEITLSLIYTINNYFTVRANSHFFQPFCLLKNTLNYLIFS